MRALRCVNARSGALYAVRQSSGQRHSVRQSGSVVRRAASNGIHGRAASDALGALKGSHSVALKPCQFLTGDTGGTAVLTDGFRRLRSDSACQSGNGRRDGARRGKRDDDAGSSGQPHGLTPGNRSGTAHGRSHHLPGRSGRAGIAGRLLLSADESSGAARGKIGAAGSLAGKGGRVRVHGVHLLSRDARVAHG
jgi:hypothetical protein